MIYLNGKGFLGLVLEFSLILSQFNDMLASKKKNDVDL